MTTGPTKRAILFLNLGGPETLADVRPFLYRLFSDPGVIRVRFAPLRKLIAWAIATGREKTSRSMYAAIGGGSPIRRLTEAQAAGTERLLRGEGYEALVRTAFTCAPPLVEDVVRELAQSGVTRFLAIPLFPQYSLTTTKGALDRARVAATRHAPHAGFDEVRSWPTHALFLQAHAEVILAEASKFSDPRLSEIHLLFSAHSIPEKLVSEHGDPYRDEMEATARGVVEAAGWTGPWSLAWQSRLGPVRWLSPATPDVLAELGRAGIRQVLLVPIAFVTDHIETLYEIDQLFARVAREVGIAEFRRTPGLNDHRTFLRALADIAKGQRDFWE